MKGTKFLSYRRPYFRSFIKANTFCGHQERRKEKKENAFDLLSYE